MKISCSRALNRYVLAVAVERIDGWCGYINAVHGDNHRAEAEDVAKYGAKLTQEVAEAIFGGAMCAEFADRGLEYVY